MLYQHLPSKGIGGFSLRKEDHLLSSKDKTKTTVRSSDSFEFTLAH
jgi:hypothetical protein